MAKKDGQQCEAKHLLLPGSEKHMSSREGKPRYSKVKTVHEHVSIVFIIGDLKESGCFPPTWSPRGPCLGGL